MFKLSTEKGKNTVKEQILEQEQKYELEEGVRLLELKEEKASEESDSSKVMAKTNLEMKVEEVDCKEAPLEGQGDTQLAKSTVLTTKEEGKGDSCDKKF